MYMYKYTNIFVFKKGQFFFLVRAGCGFRPTKGNSRRFFLKQD